MWQLRSFVSAEMNPVERNAFSLELNYVPIRLIERIRRERDGIIVDVESML